MPIIKYLGKFCSDGQVGDKTTVVWTCDICGDESKTRYGAYQRGTGMCRICAKLGKPLLENEALAQYPQIEKVVTFGKRGDVINLSRVITRCSVCNRVCETLFQALRYEERNAWRCQGCAKREQFGKEIIMPHDLPDFVTGYVEGTLGALGNIQSNTIVDVLCPDCGDVRQSEWKNISRGGSSVSACKSCATTNGWRDGQYQAHSSKMVAKWQDKEYRDKNLTARANLGYYSSKLHKSVKKALVESGIDGFESEKYVAGYMVDEIDKDRNIILEVFGDFWHCNPSLYNPDDTISLDGKAFTASEIWMRDKKRINELASHGYSVYIIWENDFKTAQEQTISDLIQWIEFSQIVCAEEIKCNG